MVLQCCEDLVAYGVTVLRRSGCIWCYSVAKIWLHMVLQCCEDLVAYGVDKASKVQSFVVLLALFVVVVVVLATAVSSCVCWRGYLPAQYRSLHAYTIAPCCMRVNIYILTLICAQFNALE